MDKLFGLIFFVCFVLFLIGFFSPKTSLFWDKKNEPTRKRSAVIYGIAIFASLILIGMTADPNTKGNAKSSETDTTSSETNKETSEPEKVVEEEKSNEIGIGQTLQTDYFAITVNKVSVQERVNTGNQFADLKKEEGNNYLIINASFKNTDNESRMLVDGSVWINYNGKDYEFDKSETVMLEGWGIILDQINPLTSKTTNIVYKIPSEIKGNAYWQPGRADNDQRILLGNL